MVREQDIGVKWFNTVFYPQNKTARAVRYEDGILPRLRNSEITFFTPWGPRYRWEQRGTAIKEADREVKTLRFLSKVLEELQGNMKGKKFCWIFLGADLYGTRINLLPQEVVDDYFKGLGEWVTKEIPNARFLLWSEFDEQAEPFRQKVRNQFLECVDIYTLERAVRTAKQMNGGDAREYLIERIAEGMLIEGRFSPVKVSCVARHKDDKVDWHLPRLYVLPEQLHAPWL